MHKNTVLLIVYLNLTEKMSFNDGVLSDVVVYFFSRLCIVKRYFRQKNL